MPSRMRGQIGCKIMDCLSVYEAKGYCSRHYERWQKYGNPLVDFKGGNQFSKKPDSIRMSEEEWKNLTPHVRSRMVKNGDSVDKRTSSLEDKIYSGWVNRIFRRYNLSEGQYWDLYYTQNTKCAICKEFSFKRLYVDHDHNCCPTNSACKKCIRGLVCHRCNTLLGHARDNINILKNAINYLDRVITNA